MDRQIQDSGRALPRALLLETYAVKVIELNGGPALPLVIGCALMDSAMAQVACPESGVGKVNAAYVSVTIKSELQSREVSAEQGEQWTVEITPDRLVYFVPRVALSCADEFVDCNLSDAVIVDAEVAPIMDAMINAVLAAQAVLDGVQ